MGVDRDPPERVLIRFRFEFDHGLGSRRLSTWNPGPPFGGVGGFDYADSIRIARASLSGLLPVPILLTVVLLLAACGPMGFVTVDGGSAQCAGNPEPEMCERAFKAVVAELGDRARDGQIRIDPVQCAHGRCWTWAYLTPAHGGGDQQLSVDWLPSGEISIGYVVQH